MIRTTTMVRRNATKNTRGGPRQEDNHDHNDGQKECNQEHKRVTTMMAKRRVSGNTRR
jgi:hypothetical protein